MDYFEFNAKIVIKHKVKFISFVSSFNLRDCMDKTDEPRYRWRTEQFLYT